MPSHEGYRETTRQYDTTEIGFIKIPCNKSYPNGKGENLEDDEYIEVCSSLSPAS